MSSFKQGDVVIDKKDGDIVVVESVDSKGKVKIQGEGPVFKSELFNFYDHQGERGLQIKQEFANREGREQICEVVCINRRGKEGPCGRTPMTYHMERRKIDSYTVEIPGVGTRNLPPNRFYKLPVPIIKDTKPLPVTNKGMSGLNKLVEASYFDEAVVKQITDLAVTTRKEIKGLTKKRAEIDKKIQEKEVFYDELDRAYEEKDIDAIEELIAVL